MNSQPELHLIQHGFLKCGMSSQYSQSAKVDDLLSFQGNDFNPLAKTIYCYYTMVVTITLRLQICDQIH